MKFIFAALLGIISSNLFAAETYDCNFGGSHFFLKMHDDQSITLENKFQKFSCVKSSTNFPGTEVEQTTLVCAGHYKKVTYFMNHYDENTIILTPDVVFSKDVTCKKTN